MLLRLSGLYNRKVIDMLYITSGVECIDLSSSRLQEAQDVHDANECSNKMDNACILCKLVPFFDNSP